MTIKITPAVFNVSGKPAIRLVSPYHPDFPARARALGGTWHSDHWTFDARDEPEVRKLCFDIYGTDGSPVPTVDLDVTLDGFSDSSEVWLVGRQLARRCGRVFFGDGVRVQAGGFPDRVGRRGGLSWEKGTVLLVRDVPISLVDHLTEREREHIHIHGAPPPTEIPQVFREALGEADL